MSTTPAEALIRCETCEIHMIHVWGNWEDHHIEGHSYDRRYKAAWQCTGRTTV